jgi:hypothetical protein
MKKRFLQLFPFPPTSERKLPTRSINTPLNPKASWDVTVPEPKYLLDTTITQRPGGR